jgi:hypothetical protein
VWQGQKIEQYSDKNELQIKPYQHKLLLNSDATYFWPFMGAKTKGRWAIDSFSDSTQMLTFETLDGVSNGGIYIYHLTEKALVLRMFSLVADCHDCNNSIDIFFKRKK